MARARVDTSIKRQTAPVEGGGGGGDFDFPLGVYPVEPLTPIEGYTIAFESADDGPPAGGGGGGSGGGRGTGDQEPDEEDDEPWRTGGGGRGEAGQERAGDGLTGFDDGIGDGLEDEDLEPWPDRYVFDINIRASRVESLCRQLYALLPGRVFPILDVMGNDGYREIDPYIAYDLVGLERFLEALRRFRGWFFEDGMVGFGAMSEEPFVYIFVDEHKIVTVRVAAGAKEQVEKILTAFDLEEVDKIAGADAAVHEHRGVLDAPSNRPDLLTHDEIVEQLRDDWGLTLNVDPFNNNDEHGNALGMVPWRCVVRVFDEGGEVRYTESFLAAESLQNASELAISAAESLLSGDDPTTSPGLDNESDLDFGDPLTPPPSTGKSPDRPSTPPGEFPSRGLGRTGGQSVDKPGRPGRADAGITPGDRDSGGGMDEIPLDDLSLDMEEFDILVADRIRPEDADQFPALVAKRPLDLKTSRVIAARWME
ncbi:MAG: hypothetical protein Q8L55_11865 [Phycisphaerales bacterium]|nr:hypothetical protein [Phycisphaerales bacterium]